MIQVELQVISSLHFLDYTLAKKTLSLTIEVG